MENQPFNKVQGKQGFAIILEFLAVVAIITIAGGTWWYLNQQTDSLEVTPSSDLQVIPSEDLEVRRPGGENNLGIQPQADLSVNGFDGDVILKGGDNVTLSWTSVGSSVCAIGFSGMQGDVGFSQDVIESLPSSGNKILVVPDDHYQFAYYWLRCDKSNNHGPNDKKLLDEVNVNFVSN